VNSIVSIIKELGFYVVQSAVHFKTMVLYSLNSLKPLKTKS